jgi:DNA-binding CsgD family transcriptional regulator
VYKISTVDKMNRRNGEILHLKQQGSSYAEIAVLYGISRQRVFQIVKRDEKKLTPNIHKNPLRAILEALGRGLKWVYGGLLWRIRKGLF